MSSQKPQAISGVSASRETEMMIVYPSIASHWLGQILGRLFESIPLKIHGIKLSYLLFPLPMIPAALGLYFHLKVFGERYVLTNRSLGRQAALGSRVISQIPLADVDRIEVEQSPGHVFYKAADLAIFAADGKSLMRLEAVPRADVFRQTILKASVARQQVGASLATIEARQSV